MRVLDPIIEEQVLVLECRDDIGEMVGIAVLGNRPAGVAVVDLIAIARTGREIQVLLGSFLTLPDAISRACRQTRSEFEILGVVA